MKNLLESKQSLNHYATIYVPSTKGTSGKAASDFVEATKAHVAQAMAQIFGGFTISEGTGGYVSETDGLVTETVHMIRSNSDRMEVEHTNLLVELAEYVRDRHEQECVSLEIDGKLYFI